MRAIAILAVLMALLACGEETGEESVETVTLPEITLGVTDSIGIEMGDSNYVFGSVMDVEVLENGNIMVLDGSRCKVSLFSPQGEYLYSFAGEGSGPGELLNPFSLFVWGNGEVSVIDVYAGGIHRYTEQGEWLGQDLQITQQSFIDPTVVGDNRFVSFKPRFFLEGDAVMATAFVGLFPMDPEPEITYWEKTVPWDPANMGNLANELLFSSQYAADPATGRVYVSPFSGDEYEILCFAADGTELTPITMEYTPIPKTDEEIQAEKDFVEFFLRNSESNNPNLNYECDPWPNHQAVTGLYMGFDGDLWAQRGGYEELTFDVWDENGALKARAAVPGLPVNGQSWQLAFGEETAVAWSLNPESFQKIYILRRR